MNYVNAISNKMQNNYQTMIVASSICLIGFTILKNTFQTDKVQEKEQKTQRKKPKKNKQIDIIKNSKRTFLTDQDNSENANDVYETDIPKTQNIKKSYAKTFYTDAEGKHNFRNRQKNKMRQENDKIDALYFAVLDKIEKKQLFLKNFIKKILYILKFVYNIVYEQGRRNNIQIQSFSKNLKKCQILNISYQSTQKTKNSIFQDGR